jgi:hypothetical protein
VSGNAITTIESGRLFYLNLSTQDLRNSGAGVYSVYADVYYDSHRIDVAGVSQFFGPYDNGQSSLISEDGVIDEWGAFAGVEITGSGEIIVGRIPVRATGEGTVLFGLSGADDSPLHDVLLYDSAVPISHDQIKFHAVELIIVDAEGETGEGEAYFAKSITSSTPDRVITAPAAVQQLLIDDALRSTAAASWAPRYEDDANEKENSWQDSLATIDAFFADDTVDD